jgi:hypothetical protein
MGRLRQQVKAIIRDALQEKRASGAQGRIGTVTVVNDDGTVAVSIDGGTVTCNTSYPLVANMQVLVMLTPDGNRVAIPTLPPPSATEIAATKFFSGGNIKFAAGSGRGGGVLGGGIFFQQVGSSKVYQLDITDLPADIFATVQSFSPNGKKIGLFGFNASVGSPASRYRVYSIGDELTEDGVIDAPNQIFKLKATLLHEVIRPINNVYTTVSPNPIFRPGAVWVDNDTIFWTETILANRGLGAGEANMTLAFMGIDSGGNPLTIAQIVIEFVAPAGPPLNAQFREIVAFGSGSGIFNGTKQEILMQQTSPFGSGNLLPTVLPTVPATPPQFGIEIPAPSYTATAAPPQTISPGCSQVFVSNGLFPVARAIVSTLKAKTALFRGTGGSPEDFLRVIVEATGTITQSTSTNTISGDASLSTNCVALLNSTSKGFFLDALGHVRLVTSANGGVTFTIGSDPTKYLKVSPGQVDPTLLRLINDPLFATAVTAAVSTL